MVIVILIYKYDVTQRVDAILFCIRDVVSSPFDKREENM
jgi:hypothetical protein